MIMNKITTLLSILFISGLFCSCEHPGMEYIIQEKGLNVQESTIYVDGFLATGTPAFAGDENEPGDRLGIPFVNGWVPVKAYPFIIVVKTHSPITTIRRMASMSPSTALLPLKRTG